MEVTSQDPSSLPCVPDSSLGGTGTHCLAKGAGGTVSGQHMVVPKDR